MDAHIPKKRVVSYSFPPWYNSRLIKLVREKMKFFHKYKTYGSPVYENKYHKLRARHKTLEKQYYDAYIKRIENSINKNPRQFFSYIKSNSKSKGLPNIMHYNNETANNGQDICNLFQKYFTSVFEKSYPVNNNLFNSETNYSSVVSDVEINENIIKKHITRLDKNKSPGPDKIPPIFLKECSHTLCKPLCLLFNLSLKSGVFPIKWKEAFVSPIHKDGSKNDMKNYRPISKLNIIAKLFEKIVYEAIYAAIGNLISPRQHGFVAGRSTLTNLAVYNNFLVSNMHKNKQVDAVYTDFSKAFDKVDFFVLEMKLKLIGVHGNLLRWVISYVRNRGQAVVAGGYRSDWVTTTSGVPQGSILASLLFDILINDIESCFHHSNILLYADDLKVYKDVQTIEDCNHLQSDLNRFSDYCVLNRLHLNISKCFSITFTRKKNTLLYKYKLCNSDLIYKDVAKDLGIYLDSKLLYDKHINHITSKAIKTLGFIIRQCKKFNDPDTMKTLYNTYVRCQLEYASQIWNPQYAVYINQLDRVQNKFLRFLNFKCRVKFENYNESTAYHNMQALSARRELADQLFLYKIVNNNLDCSDLVNSIQYRVPGKHRLRHVNLFTHTVMTTNYASNSYLPRVINNYNKKFSHIDPFQLSQAQYKNRIRTTLNNLK